MAFVYGWIPGPGFIVNIIFLHPVRTVTSLSDVLVTG